MPDCTRVEKCTNIQRLFMQTEPCAKVDQEIFTSNSTLFMFKFVAKQKGNTSRQIPANTQVPYIDAKALESVMYT